MLVVRTLVGGLLLLNLGAVCGCSELQARNRAREGNRHYRDGNYAAAVSEYEEAERLRPGIPAVVLNLGLACRQLMIPGANSPENTRATDCALSAFKRLKELNPNDQRGEQLYIQTLFDADRFDELIRIYEGQLRAKADDMFAVEGLVQVHARANNWREELRWTAKRADLRRDDAEAQYAVGVFIWDQLFRKGGSGPKATFDPRPNPDEEEKVAPEFGPNEIGGQERIKLADQGISYLKRALAIRPKYREAVIYLNLLYRQKSYAFFDQPEKWLELLNEAETWRKKAMEMKPQEPPPQKPAQPDGASK